MVRDVLEGFVNSNRFERPIWKATKHSGYGVNLSTYWKKGILCPGNNEEYAHPGHALIYGPVFGDSMKLRNWPTMTNVTLCIGMMTRLLGTKKDPDYKGSGYKGMSVDRNESYFYNQDWCINRFRGDIMDYFLSLGIRSIIVCNQGVFDDLERSLIPGHPKYEQRKLAFAFAGGLGTIFDRSSHVATHVMAYVKMEAMKFGKPCRMFISIGGTDMSAYGGPKDNVLASMTGSDFVKQIKEAMASKPLVVIENGIRAIAIFVAGPIFNHLKIAFESLRTGIYEGVEYDIFFVYFSDDSCVFLRGKDRDYVVNVDIASCDASHSPHIFKLLRQLLDPDQNFPLGGVLVDHLLLPVQIQFNKKSEQFRGRKSVVTDTLTFKPKAECLYSGSVLTTLTNNLACILMFRQAVADRALDPNQFRISCAKAGYIVTMDECEIHEDIQFLKHSPARGTIISGDQSGESSYIPVMNLGPLFRTIGTKADGQIPNYSTKPSNPLLPSFVDLVKSVVKQDPPRPKKIGLTMDQACRSFTSGLIHGMYPRLNCPVLTALHGTDHQVVTKLDVYDKKVCIDAPLCVVSACDMLRRYRMEHLAERFVDLMAATTQLGRVYNSLESVQARVGNAVLSKDYSLNHINDDQQLFPFQSHTDQVPIEDMSKDLFSKYTR